jgi:hypothetical protein
MRTFASEGTGGRSFSSDMNRRSTTGLKPLRDCLSPGGEQKSISSSLLFLRALCVSAVNLSFPSPFHHITLPISQNPRYNIYRVTTYPLTRPSGGTIIQRPQTVS